MIKEKQQNEKREEPGTEKEKRRAESKSGWPQKRVMVTRSNTHVFRYGNEHDRRCVHARVGAHPRTTIQAETSTASVMSSPMPSVLLLLALISRPTTIHLRRILRVSRVISKNPIAKSE